MTNIQQLEKQLDQSINDLVVNYLNYKPETRCNLLNSLRSEARQWSGCNSGSVMEFIWRVFNNYNNYNKNDEYKQNPDSKITLIKKIKNGLHLDPNDKYFYWLELSRDMCDNFVDELNIHHEWVEQGFECQEDYIASKCEECARIYDDYTNTDPCSNCGTVWWTVSK